MQAADADVEKALASGLIAIADALAGIGVFEEKRGPSLAAISVMGA